MRTVTFSDVGVVRNLEKSFVCAWTNKRPSEEFPDGERRRSSMRVSNGAGAANVTSVFAMPDGTVLHAMAGSMDPELFRVQVEFALYLRQRLYDGKELKPHGRASYVAAHTTAQKQEDVLRKGVHKILARKMWSVKDMPLNLFDEFGGDRPCRATPRPPTLCGLSALR